MQSNLLLVQNFLQKWEIITQIFVEIPQNKPRKPKFSRKREKKHKIHPQIPAKITFSCGEQPSQQVTASFRMSFTKRKRYANFRKFLINPQNNESWPKYWTQGLISFLKFLKSATNTSQANDRQAVRVMPNAVNRRRYKSPTRAIDRTPERPKMTPSKTGRAEWMGAVIYARHTEASCERALPVRRLRRIAR